MKEKRTKIINESGLHARPASQFVGCAKKFKSSIFIMRDSGDKINAKSIVMLLSSAISMGEYITIGADGEDEIEAVDTLVELVDSGFGE